MAVSCETVGGSSLNPNAPHSIPMLDLQIEDILLVMREWVRTEVRRVHEQQMAYVHWLHQCLKQEMADLLDSGFSEPPVPKNRMRPRRIIHQPRARPKCSPRRIIHQPR